MHQLKFIKNLLAKNLQEIQNEWEEKGETTSDMRNGAYENQQVKTSTLSHDHVCTWLCVYAYKKNNPKSISTSKKLFILHIRITELSTRVIHAV